MKAAEALRAHIHELKRAALESIPVAELRRPVPSSLHESVVPNCLPHLLLQLRCDTLFLVEHEPRMKQLAHARRIEPELTTSADDRAPPRDLNFEAELAEELPVRFGHLLPVGRNALRCERRHRARISREQLRVQDGGQP